MCNRSFDKEQKKMEFLLDKAYIIYYNHSQYEKGSDREEVRTRFHAQRELSAGGRKRRIRFRIHPESRRLKKPGESPVL